METIRTRHIVSWARLLLVAVLGSALLLGAAGAAHAGTAAPNAATVAAPRGAPAVVLYGAANPAANIRSGPSTAYKVVGTLRYGQQVAGRLAAGGWWQIAPGRYVAGSVVATAKPRQARSALDKCIDKVDPKRTTVWHTSNPHGTWGTTDQNNGVVWIDTARIPARYLCSVVYHEWIHVLQSRANPRWRVTAGQVNRVLGTSGLRGLEYVADCGALQLGAIWIHYGCRSAAEKKMAANLLAGKPIV